MAGPCGLLLVHIVIVRQNVQPLYVAALVACFLCMCSPRVVLSIEFSKIVGAVMYVCMYVYVTV